MINRLALVISLIALLVGFEVCYQSAVVSTRSGDDAPVFSVRRHDPYGTAALMDLLTERGIPVKTLEQPVLTANDHGVLIQVIPYQQSIFSHDRYHLRTRDLIDWIAQGNTVVQFTRGQSDLMAHYKIAPTTQPIKELEEVEAAEATGTLPKDLPGEAFFAKLEEILPGQRLALRSPMQLDFQKGANWRPIARIVGTKSSIVAGEIPIGAGELIVVGAPTPVLNGGLDEKNNLDFLLATIGKGPVILDEWSHGVGHEATIMGFLHEVGLLPVLVQVAFLALLYVWSTSGFSRQLTPAPARQRSSIEQIETLGFLYSRALGSEITFDRVKAEVNRRLSEALRCRPRELSARCDQLQPNLKEKAQRLFEKFRQVQPAERARCQTCGYDLTLNVSGKCPECGTEILGEMRQRIAEAGTGSPPPPEKRPLYYDNIFVDILTASNQLSQEIQRERRANR